MKGISKILILSLIGILERFSFYAILLVLTLFLISPEIGFSVDESSRLYSFFLNCTYFLPIAFGLLADLTNRRVILCLGLVAMIIGYPSVYWLSGSISGLYFSLGITALGISAFKPNILVIIGDIAINSKQHKLALQGYILFGLLGSIGGFFSGFLSAIIRIEYGYQTLFLVAGLSLIPALLLYYFLFFKASHKLGGFKYQKIHGLILSVIFLISFLLAFGFKIIYLSINDLIDFKAMEDLLDNEFTIKKMIESAKDLIYLAIGFTVFSILFIKSIRVEFKYLVTMFSVGIVLVVIFLIYSNYNLINISLQSNKLYFTIILVMSSLEILILPMIRYYSYMYSFKYKGFVFGLFFAQFVVISKFLVKHDPGDNTLMYISVALLILISCLIIISKRKAKLPNNVLR